MCILKIGFIVAFLLSCGTAKAQVDRAAIRQQIKFHREWMKEHTPNPSSLNDSALIIETVRAIYSSCREPQVGAMIRYAGRKYGIQDLVDYARIRDRQDIDKDDAKAIKCLDKLVQQAHHLFGKVSYPEAYAYMYRVLASLDIEDKLQVVAFFSKITEELLQSDSILANQEISLMARACKCFFQAAEFENPTIYREMHILTNEIEDFYKRTEYRSDVQVELLSMCCAYLNKTSLYQNYYAFENRRMIKDGIIEESNMWIPKDWDLDNSNPSLPDIIGWIYRKVLHPNHPDVLRWESAYGLFGKSAEDCIHRLQYIQTFQREYDEKRHWSSYDVDCSLRYWQLVHQEAIEDTTSQADIEMLKQCISSTNPIYLLALSNAVFMEANYFHSHLNALISEIEPLLKVNEGEDKIKKLYDSYFYRETLQRARIPGHESDLYDFAQEYLNCCDQYPNWRTLALGKTLAENFLTMWSDPSTAMMLQRRLTKLLKELVGDHNPIFVMEYLRYGQMVRDNAFRVASTLDGTQGADSLFVDLIRCAPFANVVSHAYLCAGEYYCKRGETALGRQNLYKALQHRREEISQYPVDDLSFQESMRYDMATIYAYLLRSYSHEANTVDLRLDTIHYYAQCLQEQLDELTFSPNLNWDLFSTLSSYYIWNQQFSKAKTLLQKCLEFYDNQKGNIVDLPYLMIIQNLIKIAGIIDNDMNLCQELAERLERDLRGFENMGNYENYITLLRTLYDLVESKTPNDWVLLIRYQVLLDKAISEYWEASNHNDDVWYNHGLYLAMNYLKLYSRSDNLRMLTSVYGGDVDALNIELEKWRQHIVSEIVPELNQRRQQFETQKINAWQSLTFFQIVLSQAVAAECVSEELTQPEMYYREIIDHVGNIGLPYLGRFFSRHERWDDSLPIFEKLDSLVHSPGEKNPYGQVGVRDQINLAGDIFFAYFKSGRYEDALRMAEEYNQYVTSFIENNFDLMTNIERTGFIANVSSGSFPLLKMLPLMPRRVASYAYNAALRDKGLLLRSSDRLQHAIAASRNDTLIQAVDSLRMMQQQLSSIQSTTLDASVQFASLREQMDRLERYIARKASAFRSKEDEVPTWQQVRDKLKKEEVAVEYLMTDSAIMALVVTPSCQTPQYVPVIMSWEEGQDLIQSFTEKSPTELADSLYGPGKTLLYEKLWKPLEPYLGEAKIIYFSPTGILNALSFAAFTLPDDSYLIDHYELHQMTTTALLANRDTRKKTKKREMTANIYGAIYYNEEQREYYTPRLASLRHSFKTDNYLAQNTKQRGQAEEFAFLENSLYEVDAIETLLQQEKVQVNKQIGEAPTEQLLRQLDGKSPDILLISTHGFFYNNVAGAIQVPYLAKRKNTLNSMTSTGLILADGERAWQDESKDNMMNDDTDNIWAANEVAAMDLTNTQLAILSACETGLGSANTMEGVYGLQRGFKQAGVRSLCASLWSVNDRSTADLIQSFFRHWLSKKSGMTMQQAMIEAMKEQRARTPEPYYWAPFVLYDADF